ncbi:MAG: alpha-ketoglutarate-dependent dioxygenase AlkB [Thauera sp.]|jgi:alkylated DNA repair dioxygenase AlkB|nr:alpha-ketoglutarate-dependent dioxygenase AlkB [Thauera sp.]
MDRQPEHLTGDWIELPDARLYFEADFIADHEAVFAEYAGQLAWTQDRIVVYGRESAIPRLNAWYGDPGTDYAYSGLQLRPRPWTPALDALRQRLSEHLRHPFNSVLANYYRDGADCVGRHADDEPELGPQPLIATISLGATRRFALHRNDRSVPSWRADLPGGSLFVMAGRCQRAWQHEITRTARPVGGRISLTFRHVVSDK